MIFRLETVLLVGVLASGTLCAETIHLRDQLGAVDAARIDFEPGGVRLINAVSAPEPLEPVDESDPLSADPNSDSVSDLPVTSSFTKGRLIPWDQIRAIDGIQDPTLEVAWPQWQSLSEDLWRARTRLQRGDRVLSAPLFAKHFDRMVADPEGSELGLIVAEGLLRSRLPSGAIESLLPAALEVVRLRRAGYRTDRYDEMPSILDEQYWLVPQLAPIPTQTDLDPQAMRVLLSTWIDGPDPVVAELAQAYSALHDSPQERLVTTNLTRANSSGASLVHAALRSGCSDPAARKAARKALDAVLPVDGRASSLLPWRAWFLGTSLLFEEQAALDSALIELLSLPALHLSDDPALALRAIEVSATALDAYGRSSEASALRQEIDRLEFSVPPALQPKVLSIPTPASGVVSEEETR